MLEGVEDLTLARLNDATQAWVEYDYNQKQHAEIGQTPLARFLAGPDVIRPCPDTAALRLAFTRAERRIVRKSDGTVSLEGRRFEVPNRYRHLSRIDLRYAAWDLSTVHLIDADTGAVLCRLFPQDKTKNASGRRRPLDPVAGADAPSTQATSLPRSAPAAGIAPRLAAMLDRQAATGLAPAYLPKDEDDPQ